MPTRFRCIIPSCSSGGKRIERKNIILHSFPKDQKILAQWIKNIKPHLSSETLEDWMNKSSNRVCSLRVKNWIKAGHINVPTVFEKSLIAEEIGLPF
eukprot:Seg7557.1 transcript_id=Seg7557.1/GoldUCD/mRNA.D3Y31 product="hypothetical protein" pseudo=true protein_id=Seg7557.1/GoldUCD/D3Y31